MIISNCTVILLSAYLERGHFRTQCSGSYKSEVEASPDQAINPQPSTLPKSMHTALVGHAGSSRLAELNRWYAICSSRGRSRCSLLHLALQLENLEKTIRPRFSQAKLAAPSGTQTYLRALAVTLVLVFFDLSLNPLTIRFISTASWK